MISSVTSTIRRRVGQALAAVAIVLVSPVLAHAQQSWLAVNGGGQVASNSFAHVVDVPLFRTSLRAHYPVRHGGVFDVGTGFFFPWSIGLGSVRVGLGASFTLASVGHDATLQAEIRSALVPDGPLRFEGVEPLARSEKGGHIHVAGSLPVGERTSVSIYAGPSYLSVDHDVVSDIDIPLVGTGAISRSSALEVHGNAWGFNAGADVAFFLTDRLGVGFGVRVTGATVRIENLLLRNAAAQRSRVASRAGGVQMLGGVRLRLP